MNTDSIVLGLVLYLFNNFSMTIFSLEIKNQIKIDL